MAMVIRFVSFRDEYMSQTNDVVHGNELPSVRLSGEDV